MKLIKDCLTDPYGKDYDFASVTAVIGYFNGMLLYDLHMFTHLVPSFDLAGYALGYGGLMAAVIGSKKFNPTPIVPDISKQ